MSPIPNPLPSTSCPRKANYEDTIMATQAPNILVIFGDDIGIPQVSAYTKGLMGYKTPNIDRIADEGAMFTDAYGQQSCSARACSPSACRATLMASPIGCPPSPMC